MSTNPLDIQIGGNHYKGFPMQPLEFIHQNNLGCIAGCIIKRICRFDQPTGKGIEDLRKIDHELSLLIDQIEKGHIEPTTALKISVEEFCSVNQLSPDKQLIIDMVTTYKFRDGVADLYQAKDLCLDITEAYTRSSWLSGLHKQLTK